MWSGEAGGGRGEAAKSVTLAGYWSLPQLVAEIGQRIAGWDDLSEFTVRFWWVHPEARGRKERR